MTQGLPQVVFRAMSEADHAALQSAVDILERTSFVERLAAATGRRIGFAGRMLPPDAQAFAAAAARRSLETALHVAVSSLAVTPRRDGGRLHQRLAAVSGAVGGAIGLASLPVELPVSTTIMLRSIADIARREGENLADPEALIACLQVFALGGHAEEGNLLEGGYLALRGLLAKSVTDAARFMGGRAAADATAPALARFLALVSTRFGVVVSQKAAAQAVPLIGALSGAAINLAFIRHFQRLAQGHFTVRRLERVYGREIVYGEYARMAGRTTAAEG
ncbi:EcsC family protein [Methylosinus sp. Sm6]|uniref:EcsC family protein n=1 Tax=Methylosinus sp. Sm6 TaxID=2866948 RepID=UPI00351D8FFC